MTSKPASKPEGYLTEEELCKELGINGATLRNWRWQRRGPKPTKIGRRTLYRRDAINAWLLTREDTYKSEAPKRGARQ